LLFTICNIEYPFAGHSIAHIDGDFDERTLVDGRLSLEDISVGEGNMRLTLWGKNLTDADYPVYSINFGALGIITEQYGAPRTWGVELAYEY